MENREEYQDGNHVTNPQDTNGMGRQQRRRRRLKQVEEGARAREAAVWLRTHTALAGDPRGSQDTCRAAHDHLSLQLQGYLMPFTGIHRQGTHME